ncbi:MAG: hypothetical protein Q9227_008901 [Pyrenula ochraceoflavens]
MLHAMEPSNAAGITNKIENKQHGNPSHTQFFLSWLRSKRAFGEYHPTTTRHLINLSIILMKLGQHDKAQRMLRKAISEMEIRFPPRLPEYLCALCSLATSYYVVDRRRNGDFLLAKCLVYEDAFHEPALKKNLEAARLSSHTQENTLVFMDIPEPLDGHAGAGVQEETNIKEIPSKARRHISLPKLFLRSRLKDQGKDLDQHEEDGTWRCSVFPRKALSERNRSKQKTDVIEDSKAIEAWSVVIKLSDDVARDSFPGKDLVQNVTHSVRNASGSAATPSERVVPNRARTIRWLLDSTEEETRDLEGTSRTPVELPTPYNLNFGHELPVHSGSPDSTTPADASQESPSSDSSECDSLENFSQRDVNCGSDQDLDEHENSAPEWILPELPGFQTPVRFSLAMGSNAIGDPPGTASAENGKVPSSLSSSSDDDSNEPLTPTDPPVIMIDLPDTTLDTFFADCGVFQTSENCRHGQMQRNDSHGKRIRSVAISPELVPLRLAMKKSDKDHEARGKGLQLHANPFQCSRQPSYIQKTSPLHSEVNKYPFNFQHSMRFGQEMVNEFDEYRSDVCPSSLRTDRSSRDYPSQKLSAEIFKRSDNNRLIFLDQVEIFLDTGSVDVDVVSEDYCKFWGHEIHPTSGEYLQNYIGAGSILVNVIGTSKIGVRWRRHGTTSKVREFVVVRDHPQDLSFGNKTISRYGLLNSTFVMPLVLASRSQKAREQDQRQTQMIREAARMEEARKTQERLRLWDLNWEGPDASDGQRRASQQSDPALSSDISSQAGIGSRSTWGTDKRSSQSTLPSSTNSPIESTKKFI